MGIEIPKIEVRFENLSADGDVYVGSRALPTLLNVTLNAFEVIFKVFSETRMFCRASNLGSKIIFVPKKNEMKRDLERKKNCI